MERNVTDDDSAQHGRPDRATVDTAFVAFLQSVALGDDRERSRSATACVVVAYLSVLFGLATFVAATFVVDGGVMGVAVPVWSLLVLAFITRKLKVVAWAGSGRLRRRAARVADDMLFYVTCAVLAVICWPDSKLVFSFAVATLACEVYSRFAARVLGFDVERARTAAGLVS